MLAVHAVHTITITMAAAASSAQPNNNPSLRAHPCQAQIAIE
jgi:hypothetical protein